VDWIQPPLNSEKCHAIVNEPSDSIKCGEFYV